ncbi:MAG: hypothetical protein ACXW4F_07915, partial [Candidatus Deferrimicrobiaceae bacterium]
ARRLSKAPERYVARTAAAEVARELCGRGVTLRPGSKIRYLLTEGGGHSCGSGGGHSCGTKNGKAKSVPRGSVPRGQRGRAIGFLDGSEAPDLAKYEEMLREAAEEVLAPVGG